MLPLWLLNGGRFLKGVTMSKTRAPPSGANPSNLVDKRIDTEDDVLHVQVRWTTTFDRAQEYLVFRHVYVKGGAKCQMVAATYDPGRSIILLCVDFDTRDVCHRRLGIRRC